MSVLRIVIIYYLGANGMQHKERCVISGAAGVWCFPMTM